MVEEKRGSVQLTFLVLGGMTMTGVMAWMKKPAALVAQEQWRAWVFVLLNLVLLGIVFSSSKNADKKEDHKITISAVPKCQPSLSHHEIETQVQVQNKQEGGCMDDELNERVEAFILMFRQHLVADAKITTRGK